MTGIEPIHQGNLQVFELDNGGFIASFYEAEKHQDALEKAKQLMDEDRDIIADALCETFAEEYESDCENEFARMLSLYSAMSEKERAVADNVFTHLCGWSFITLVQKALERMNDE